MQRSWHHRCPPDRKGTVTRRQLLAGAVATGAVTGVAVMTLPIATAAASVAPPGNEPTALNVSVTPGDGELVVDFTEVDL